MQPALCIHLLPGLGLLFCGKKNYVSVISTVFSLEKKTDAVLTAEVMDYKYVCYEELQVAYEWQRRTFVCAGQITVGTPGTLIEVSCDFLEDNVGLHLSVRQF